MKGNMGKNRSRFGVWKVILLNLGIVLFVGIFLQNCQKNISNTIVSWGKPMLVIPNVVADDGVVSPVAVDALGNGLIVWIKSEGKGKSLWTKAYRPSQGWEGDIQISQKSLDFLDVQIAMNSIGDGIVLWSQFNEGTTRIQANTYESKLGWGTATPIQMVSENASSPQITLDKMGGGIAVWAQRSGDLGSIHTAFYRKGKGWEPSIRVSSGTGDTDDPQISMNESGDAVVVWQQSDGTDYKIWANSYRRGHGWGTAAQVQISNGDSLHPQVSLNNKGDAIVVWRQFDGTNYSLFSNYFVFGKGWGVSEQIEDHEDDAVYPHVVGDKEGNAVLVWIQRRCIERRCVLSNVWANRHEAEGGWGRPQLLAEDASGPKAVMYGNGEVVTVWTQLEGFFSKSWKITARRFKFREGWESDIRFKGGDKNAFHPTLSTNGKGDVLVVWEEIDNPNRNIWANWMANSGKGT